ncbi:PREDICTED: uncharacterized protein LOC109580362 [Amphimedon queenslandica]|uniref:ZU5 domain-containing protein n=1 Tax=Amphimedon queenslandica TaxID=400682 RepID=A0AAN0IWZ9_AMPQE|nr:PREDICTED: uncharacterized protein LOC109580362 [Amphimedon queenslandica]|eukprot:XP_019848973.1 PREDICTED: uncharacterized protein LOC109580362 [Amphimedon queenslandica]
MIFFFLLVQYDGSSFLLRDELETHIDTFGSDKIEEIAPKNIVLGEKNVTFTSDANNTVDLQQCGLSLFFPQELITTPTAAVSYDVTVKGLWAEQFVFPEGTQLISSVTSIALNSPLPLDKPVTVQLMHCASITDQSQSKYLSFAVSHSVQPPFKFDLLPGGDFLAGFNYGTIQLNEFSLIAIVLVVSATAAFATAIGYRFWQVPLLRCQGLIYYKREFENMKMNFAVLNDLPHNDAIIKFKKESYKKFGEEEWNFPFQMRTDSQLELHFPEDKPVGWTVRPLRIPPTIHERDVCAYTESKTSSDLPPYISVILRATATAAEWLDYEITVSGINIDKKDSIAIVVHKSRNVCIPSLEVGPAVIEKSNKASEVFRKKIPTLSSIIGSGTSTIFDRISDEFLGAGLISQSILDDITTVPSYSNYQRGSRLIRELHKRLQTIDAPNDNLIVVCDILTKQEDEQLVQIGKDMMKNAPHAV